LVYRFTTRDRPEHFQTADQVFGEIPTFWRMNQAPLSPAVGKGGVVPVVSQAVLDTWLPPPWSLPSNHQRMLTAKEQAQYEAKLRQEREGAGAALGKKRRSVRRKCAASSNGAEALSGQLLETPLAKPRTSSERSASFAQRRARAFALLRNFASYCACSFAVSIR